MIGTDDGLYGPSDVAAAVAAEDPRRAFGEGLSERFALQLLEAGDESAESSSDHSAGAPAATSDPKKIGKVRSREIGKQPDVASAAAAENSRRAFGEGIPECLALQLLEAGHESGRKLLRQFRGSTRGHIRPEENREREKSGNW